MHTRARWARHTARLLGATLVSCLVCAAPTAHALSVNTSVVGTLLGDSNFGDAGRSTSSFTFNSETPVPGSLPPLFGVRRGSASVDGSTGTLRASVTLSSPSSVIAGASLEMQASMEETFEISMTSGGGLRRPGVAGVGVAGDNFITIRATGVLTGQGSVGSAQGVPPGTSENNGGSTRAGMRVDLFIGSLNGGFSITEVTTLSNRTRTISDGSVDTSILGTLEVDGNTIVLNLDRDRYFALTNKSILFRSTLNARARVGNFDDAEAFADYGNSAYVNLEVEEGFFWLPGNPGNRSFLSNPAFPGPAPVPLPAAWPLFAAAVGVLARRRRVQKT